MTPASKPLPDARPAGFRFARTKSPALSHSAGARPSPANGERRCRARNSAALLTLRDRPRSAAAEQSQQREQRHRHDQPQHRRPRQRGHFTIRSARRSTRALDPTRGQIFILFRHVYTNPFRLVRGSKEPKFTTFREPSDSARGAWRLFGIHAWDAALRVKVRAQLRALSARCAHVQESLPSARTKTREQRRHDRQAPEQRGTRDAQRDFDVQPVALDPLRALTRARRHGDRRRVRCARHALLREHRQRQHQYREHARERAARVESGGFASRDRHARTVAETSLHASARRNARTIPCGFRPRLALLATAVGASTLWPWLNERAVDSLRSA